MERCPHIIFFLFLLTSCNGWIPDPVDKETELEAERKQIDWTSVDTLPIVSPCSELDGVSQLNKCLSTALQTEFDKALEGTFLMATASLDTIVQVPMRATAAGEWQLRGADLEWDLETVPDLRDVLKDVVNELPVLQPALKQGIPVQVEFPVKLRVVSGE